MRAAEFRGLRVAADLAPLPPLPSQPAGVPWPTREWPEASAGSEMDSSRFARTVDAFFAPDTRPDVGETKALLVIQRGRLVLERYAPGIDRATTLPSWSMAKSILHALVGLLVRDDRLDPAAPLDIPAWRTPGDPRGAITLDHLLRMSSGLSFREVYEANEGSDVVQMIFGRGKDDVAGFVEGFPLAHAPGSFHAYSSGDSNVVAGIVRRILGPGEPTLRYLERQLFERIGMRSAKPRFDAAGTFIGSSFVYATARDFARFGLLYLRGGVWEGEELLPSAWVDHARTPTLVPPCPGDYGGHWWLSLDGSGTFSANGFQGQYTVCSPERDVVIVRLGVSEPEHRLGLLTHLAALLRAFPPTDGHDVG